MDQIFHKESTLLNNIYRHVLTADHAIESLHETNARHALEVTFTQDTDADAIRQMLVVSEQRGVKWEFLRNV